MLDGIGAFLLFSATRFIFLFIHFTPTAPDALVL